MENKKLPGYVITKQDSFNVTSMQVQSFIGVAAVTLDVYERKKILSTRLNSNAVG